MERLFPRFMWAIWALAFIACVLIDFGYFPNAPVFPDEHRFLASANHLVANGAFASAGGRAWEMPGTALFFAPFVLLFGHEPVRAVRLMQAILLLGQSALLGWIAWRLFANRWTAVLAATMAAFYPFFLFYPGLLLSEPLFDFLLVASMASLYWWQSRGCRVDRAFVVTCVLFAATTYVKATLLFLPPLLMAAAVLASHHGMRRAIGILLASTLLFSICLTPWWVRNQLVLGHFVAFTTGSAQNLYLGNNPHNVTGGISWGKDVDPAVVARIRAITDEVDQQKAFMAEAVRYIIAHPGNFVRMMGVKFLRFWNIVPNADTYQGLAFKLISALTFGPVLLLAIACAVGRCAPFGRLSPIYLLIAFFTLVYTVTIASLRYRLPLEPFLIVLAAEPLRRVFAFLVARISRAPGEQTS